MDGLWTAEFGSSLGGFGGGVIVFRDGTLAGGDNAYYYVGEYKVDGANLTATLRVVPFLPGFDSIFNTRGRDLHLELAGRLTDGGHAVAQGFAREAPDAKMGVKLTKRS